VVFLRWRPLIYNKKGYLETGDRVHRSWKISRDAGSRGPLQIANDGRKPDGKKAGWGDRPNSRHEGSTDRGLAGGPDPK